MKQLVKEFKGIQHIKDSQDIKDPTYDDDDWDTARPK